MDAGLVMVFEVGGGVAYTDVAGVDTWALPTLAQVTVPEALVQVPWVEVADVKPTPEGRGSVTVAQIGGAGWRERAEIAEVAVSLKEKGAGAGRGLGRTNKRG